MNLWLLRIDYIIILYYILLYIFFIMIFFWQTHESWQKYILGIRIGRYFFFPTGFCKDNIGWIYNFKNHSLWVLDLFLCQSAVSNSFLKSLIDSFDDQVIWFSKKVALLKVILSSRVHTSGYFPRISYLKKPCPCWFFFFAIISFHICIRS